MVETLGEAAAAKWRLRMRCGFGEGAIARIDRCNYSYELDWGTLICTRGAKFPLSQIASRLKCPACGNDQVRVSFDLPPDAPVSAYVPAQRPYRRLR